VYELQWDAAGDFKNDFRNELNCPSPQPSPSLSKGEGGLGGEGHARQ